MLDHLSLVEGIARNVARSLPPSFDVDDLIGLGQLALLHAATRYNPGGNGGTPFSAYARLVVRGAMLESCRRNRYLENTRPGLDTVLDASSPDFEHGGDNPLESIAMGRAATPSRVDEAIDAARERLRVAEAVSWLPRAEQAVLEEYYSVAEPTLREVGTRLRMPTAAARELHASAITALRARLKRAA
ncbi:MAG: sigma-70 family RNA polymerase sigma factor [Candidatus Eremiobacteraeota bacterium]|nr:sigma-70 family RNA polymerase sigma factor [Candidatus Eremiobacteraeota bacterium]